MNRTQLIEQTEIYVNYDQAIAVYADRQGALLLERVKIAFKELHQTLNDLFVNQRFMTMKNVPVYYHKSVHALLPLEPKYGYVSDKSIKNFDTNMLLIAHKYWGDFMTLDESRKIFSAKWSFPNQVDEDQIRYDKGDNFRVAYMKTSAELGGRDLDDEMLREEPGVVVPIYRLGEVMPRPDSPTQLLLCWVKEDLIPEAFSEQEEYQIKQLMKIKSFLKFGENKDVIFETLSFVKAIMENEFHTDAFGQNWGISDIEYDDIQEQLNDSDFSEAISLLLDRDTVRADIEPYVEQMVYDPNRGLWELWPTSTAEDLDTLFKVKASFENGAIARHPVSDIRYDGVVGIDFGTKSTVVVFQRDGEHTLPMRIGMGRYSKEVQLEHYENPTVMEFIDLDKFLTDYHELRARPFTSWEDVTVSHTAIGSLMSSDSDMFYSHLSELKQWAGESNRTLRLRDKQNVDRILPAFKEVTDDFNPIEIYAYYLGLFINNQHQGIYLDYMLSFPVTYEKEIQDKIISSFRKGLLKSLPLPLHEDEEVMERFRVSSGVSEPAAYAVCALQQYGFEPTGNEKVFYSIFDFGGGTTDFDFGIWREAGAKERRYDYVIEHFGAGGDRYLGGENLLELLAFEVFKSNQQKLREEEITFMLPPECEPFVGSEVMLTDSQESKINMRQLVEALRPLWERHEGYEQQFDKGVLKVNLFDKHGNACPGTELTADRERLESIIYTRIEKGVRNFFESLRRAFSNPNIADVEVVHIFLGGNSSRSPVVQQLFETYIAKETDQISSSVHTNGKAYFEIYPPLGTEEAWEIQRERRAGQAVDIGIEAPTGKTGVAFGLIQCRKGGVIKVVDHNVTQDEAKFNYFLGVSKKGKFHVVVDRETSYGAWHLFIDAAEEDFELYFTTMPEASTNEMPIQQTERRKCRITHTNENAYVFIRAKGPNTIEYVVAEEEEIAASQTFDHIETLTLTASR
ncbi:hypothetical protein [Paenibacillus sp. YIM B09110]|uniref:hypothetical protein n=1 Tax=Paenibacillus sp. YIM B09110 TaxID=3126102 RepID=UPI00301D7E59